MIRIRVDKPVYTIVDSSADHRMRFSPSPFSLPGSRCVRWNPWEYDARPLPSPATRVLDNQPSRRRRPMYTHRVRTRNRIFDSCVFMSFYFGHQKCWHAHVRPRIDHETTRMDIAPSFDARSIDFYITIDSSKIYKIKIKLSFSNQ